MWQDKCFDIDFSGENKDLEYDMILKVQRQ